MNSNATVAATPSYSSGWDLAHQRLAEADARRMERLTEACLRRPLVRRGWRPKAVRDRQAEADRRYRANKDKPIPPCSICGGPKTRRTGSRCNSCNGKDRCACGAVKGRWSKTCRECKS